MGISVTTAGLERAWFAINGERFTPSELYIYSDSLVESGSMPPDSRGVVCGSFSHNLGDDDISKELRELVRMLPRIEGVKAFKLHGNVLTIESNATRSSAFRVMLLVIEDYVRRYVLAVEERAVA